MDIRAVNSAILELSRDLKWVPRDLAPSTEVELFNAPRVLPIWTGASENSVFQDERVNWHFRAIHDTAHLETGLGFTVEQEIELGRIQASKLSSDFLARLFWLEIAGQAEYFLKHGKFIENQLEWTLENL